jgi:colicin import membrane protein
MRRLIFAVALFSVLAVIPPVGGQGADLHAMAEAIVRDVGRDAAHRSAAATCLANATASLERATRMRAARDEPHAQAADGVALEWAMAARDLARTLDVEAKAVQVRRAAIETQAQVERAHALVDEGIARVGRLRAEIERMEREVAPGRVAVERHDEPTSKDARGPKKQPHAPMRTTPSVDAGTAP